MCFRAKATSLPGSAKAHGDSRLETKRRPWTNDSDPGECTRRTPIGNAQNVNLKAVWLYSTRSARATILGCGWLKMKVYSSDGSSSSRAMSSQKTANQILYMLLLVAFFAVLKAEELPLLGASTALWPICKNTGIVCRVARFFIGWIVSLAGEPSKMRILISTWLAKSWKRYEWIGSGIRHMSFPLAHIYARAWISSHGVLSDGEYQAKNTFGKNAMGLLWHCGNESYQIRDSANIYMRIQPKDYVDMGIHRYILPFK